MAVWSIVKYSELGDRIRLDSEFYSPNYLETLNEIKNCRYDKMELSDLVADGYRVIYENTNIITKEEAERVNGVQFIQSADVTGGYPSIDYKNVGWVTRDDWIRYPKGRLRKDELLIEVKGKAEKVVLTFDDMPNEALVTGTFYKLLTNELVLPEYLWAYFLCKYGFALRNRLKTNNLIAFVNKQDLFSIPIVVPPFPFQQEVKATIDSSYKVFLSSRSLLASAEGMLLAELGLEGLELPKTKWNVRNFSETRTEERIDAEYYLPKYYALLKELEKHNPRQLGELVSYKKGVEVGSAAYDKEGVPFWRVSDLSKEEVGGTNTAYISEELYKSLKKKYEAKQGEILFSKDATPGLAYFVREPLKGIICGGILRLQLKEEINPDYLTLLLNSEAVKMQIIREGGGSIISHLRPNSAMGLVIPIIDNDKQDEIGDKVRESHAARTEAKRLLEEAKREVEEMILEGSEKT